jgi:hypothetical protein
MNMKTIPKFEDEEQEQAFWAAQDSTELVDWSKARRVTFPNLKLLANQRDVPYQSLLKIFLAERIEHELRLVRARG